MTLDKKDYKTSRNLIIKELDACPPENTRRRDLLLKMLLQADKLILQRSKMRKKGTGEYMKGKKFPVKGGVNPGLARIKREEDKEQ